MAYIATFLGIWLVIASVLAIPVGKMLEKLAKNDRDFEPEHQIWKQDTDGAVPPPCWPTPPKCQPLLILSCARLRSARLRSDTAPPRGFHALQGWRPRQPLSFLNLAARLVVSSLASVLLRSIRPIGP